MAWNKNYVITLKTVHSKDYDCKNYIRDIDCNFILSLTTNASPTICWFRRSNGNLCFQHVISIYLYIHINLFLDIINQKEVIWCGVGLVDLERFLVQNATSSGRRCLEELNELISLARAKWKGNLIPRLRELPEYEINSKK